MKSQKSHRQSTEQDKNQVLMDDMTEPAAHINGVSTPRKERGVDTGGDEEQGDDDPEDGGIEDTDVGAVADTEDVAVEVSRVATPPSVPPPTIPPVTTSQKWLQQSQFQHAASMLRRVDKLGSKGVLPSCFLSKDPILKESDRSYLEARRIAIHIRCLRTEYKYHGIFHTTAFLLLFVFNSVCAISGGYMAFSLNSILSSNSSETFSSDQLSSDIIMLIIRPLTQTNVIICILGILWVIGFKCVKKNVGLKQKRNIIYAMYFRVLVYYILFVIPVIFSLVCSSLWLRCLDTSDKNRPNYCVSNRDDSYNFSATDLQIYILLIVTEVGYIIIPLVIAIHVFTTLCIMRCQPTVYMWQWVFFDILCKCYTMEEAPKEVGSETAKDRAAIDLAAQSSDKNDTRASTSTAGGGRAKV